MSGKKKSDPFWQYAKVIGDKEFSCTFCQHHFRGRVSIARFKSHLAGERRLGTKVCDKVLKDVQDAALQAITHTSELKKNKRPVSPNNDEEGAIISHPSSSMVKGAHQSTKMPRKIGKEEEKCLVDRKLAKFILSIGVPSNVIQSPIFIDFAKSLAEFGPGYEVPKPLVFSINSIGHVKEDVAKYVAEVKRPLAETGCTLILDHWGECDENDDEESDNSNIFIYTPKGLILEAASVRYSEIPDEKLDSVVDDIGYTHIQIFGDKRFYDNDEISTCASVKIQRFLKDLFDLNWFRKISDCASVEYLKKPDRVHYHISGFAFSFLMLQTILKDENDLKASDSNDLYSEFWRDGKELVQVLQPIFQLLNLVNGYMSTSGYLYEAFHMAKTKIEKFLIQNQDDRYKLILEKFEELRMKTIKPIHMAAALLNPDYKFSEDLKDNEIEVGINYMLEKLGLAEEEKESFRVQLDSYRTTLRPMFRKGMKIDVHPRIWWERYGGDAFPELRTCAIEVLSQPCSMFSCHRYRLKHTCCVNDYKLGVNTRLMEKYYSLLEAGDEEPIDLDKLSGSPEYEYAEKYSNILNHTEVETSSAMCSDSDTTSSS